MSKAKSERLLNLLIMLLVQRHYVGKQRIREILYPGNSDDAFERMFDRDKEELRSLGVPIEVSSVDPLFEDEVGYRIRPDEFALPEISLTADEAAVVGLAARVWQTASLAEATTDALRKLQAAGVETDAAALAIAQPPVVNDEPTFDAFWSAVQQRRVAEFDYRATGAAIAPRRLEPWGLTRHSGRWYVVGRDLDRDDERVFRLSRVQGAVRLTGRPGAFETPAGLDLTETARRLAAPAGAEQAVVLARAGSAAGLRRRAVSEAADVDGPDQRTAWDRLTLPEVTPQEILSLGDAVVVESPQSLRSDVVERLTKVVQQP